MSLLEVKDLKTYFYTDAGCAKAVDGVSFSLDKGKVLGIVGESGCGKSVTSLSIMGLVDPVTGRHEGGEILFHGEDLSKLSEKEKRKIRGNKISMIFQEPMTSLNPVFTVGYQIEEALMLHLGMDKNAARQRAVELLKLVEIPEAEKRVDEYPHQLSGGMRQRVMIAMALSCNPELLIADEPTTALDVTIQAQILELLNELTRQLFDNPMHPYTEGLMASIPDIDQEVDRLQTLEGLVPSLYDMPSGCRFGPRCKYYTEECGKNHSQLTRLEGQREVRCRRYQHE